ncbi:MAG TPA: nucleotide exchange factor GrpE, partial [Clostridiales bacterium]|nr:nucleotide exchange factor GrpE [Clostridiales bacterium]
KNRAEKEKDRIYITAVEDTICDFLPILDNLDRAIESTDETGSFKDGVHMIYTQLKQTLEKKGLKEIEALGETFDPYLHHGVSSDEVEGVEPNTIIEVFQKGYKLKDKVIRPSMVKVSR